MIKHDLADRRKLHPKTLAAAVEAPSEKNRTFSDGFGLSLVVRKNATNGQWRYAYRSAGKQRVLVLGSYPELSLSNVRKLHEAAYNEVANGNDPIELKNKKSEAQKQAIENTFELIANKWFELYIKDKKSVSHQKRTRGLLDNHILPHIGECPISELKESHISNILERMQAAGIYSSGNKARQVLRSVLMYARRSGALDTTKRIELIESMDGVIQPPVSLKKCNYAAVTEPKDLRTILLAIDAAPSHIVVKTALQLAPMLLARPIEICAAEWSEVNFIQNQLEISAERMKLREPHIIPLAHQAMALLRELHAVTGHGKYIFPSFRGASRHIATESLTRALRSAGIPKEMQAVHGFRATARTMLAQEEELQFRIDWIEHQLAHTVTDANGTAYNRTSFLKQRAEMMQAWADYLDRLKAGAEVVKLVRKQ